MRNNSRCTYLYNTTSSSTVTFTLSLHDALPIYKLPDLLKGSGVQQKINSFSCCQLSFFMLGFQPFFAATEQCLVDRKSTRLNSSHVKISYAVFCLKKKNKKHTTR